MDKKTARLRRTRKTRNRIHRRGAYRLCVHRTPRHLYAQIIAPGGATTLICASTLEKKLAGPGDRKEAAGRIGAAIAERAQAKGITEVAFDRSGFKYHGRIKILAEAARAGGLQF